MEDEYCHWRLFHEHDGGFKQSYKRTCGGGLYGWFYHYDEDTDEPLPVPEICDNCGKPTIEICRHCFQPLPENKQSKKG